MEVQRLFAEGRERDPRALDAAGIALLETGVLASEREPFDPMEKAYARLAQEASPDLSTKLAAWGRVRSYPLSPAQLSVAHVYDPGQGADWIVAAKGAPEAIADLCALPAGARNSTASAGSDATSRLNSASARSCAYPDSVSRASTTAGGRSAATDGVNSPIGTR